MGKLEKSMNFVLKKQWCLIGLTRQNDRSRFWAPPMPARGYVEENNLAAMLATKKSAGESRGTWHVCLHQVWIRLPTLALKPRGDITRTPKQGYQWPHKKDLCHPKIKKRKNCNPNTFYRFFSLKYLADWVPNWRTFNDSCISKISRYKNRHKVFNNWNIVNQKIHKRIKRNSPSKTISAVKDIWSLVIGVHKVKV